MTVSRHGYVGSNDESTDDLSFGSIDFQLIMGVLYKRMQDSGKDWRHVYKVLFLPCHLSLQRNAEVHGKTIGGI